MDQILEYDAANVAWIDGIANTYRDGVRAMVIFANGRPYRPENNDFYLPMANVLAQLERNHQLVEPSERVWSDASGKFQVKATYVDSKEGYVRLRKTDGSEISVPIKKLSREDRRLITKLARQK